MTLSPEILAAYLAEYEADRLSENDEDRLFQHLLDTGLVWRLPGRYGRAAMARMKAGRCALGPNSYLDAYGGFVPSRDQVDAGSLGSVGALKRRLPSPLR